jgi:hypothetical protein
MGSFFGFSSTKYRSRVSQYSNRMLRDEERKKRKNIVSHKCGIGVSAGFAVYTGGASLVGAALNGRQMKVEEHKLEILQKEMNKRGLVPSDLGFRDYLTSGLKGGLRSASMGGMDMGAGGYNN